MALTEFATSPRCPLAHACEGVSLSRRQRMYRLTRYASRTQSPSRSRVESVLPVLQRWSGSTIAELPCVERLGCLRRERFSETALKGEAVTGEGAAFNFGALWGSQAPIHQLGGDGWIAKKYDSIGRSL